MRSINRIHGVILGSIGVLLGVMLTLSPGGALATSLDVLTIGGTDHFLDDTVPNQLIVEVPLPPGEPPSHDGIQQLQETEFGVPIFDVHATPIISDTLQVQSFFIGNVQVGCQPLPIGCVPIFVPQFGERFTLTSDPNSGGLGFISGVRPVALELAGGNLIGGFGSLGLVFVRSDIDPVNVPEPSTWLLLLLLLGCGVAGLAAWQRKRESELQ